MNKKTKPKNVTQSELARKLGISRQLLAAHVRKGGAPPLDDFEAWLAHLVANGREGSLMANATPEMRRELIRLKMRVLDAQARRLERANEVQDEKFILWEVAERFVEKLIRDLVFGELDRVALELPVRLRGASEVKVWEEVRGQIVAMKENLGRSIDAWVRSRGRS
jgi:transcriptional regulator with XRE-family HTH domain